MWKSTKKSKTVEQVWQRCEEMYKKCKNKSVELWKKCGGMWGVSVESVRTVRGKFGGVETPFMIPIHCCLDGREALRAWVLGPFSKGMNDSKAGATTTLHFLHKCFALLFQTNFFTKYTFLVHFVHAYFKKIAIFTYTRLSMSSDSYIYIYYTYKCVRDNQD